MSYPLVPRTVLYKEYVVIKRLPHESRKVVLYNYSGDRRESWLDIYKYIVSDGKFSYELATNHDDLVEGVRIKVSYRNGDYKIK